jgi:hypothetical protein
MHSSRLRLACEPLEGRVMPALAFDPAAQTALRSGVGSISDFGGEGIMAVCSQPCSARRPSAFATLVVNDGNAQRSACRTIDGPNDFAAFGGRFGITL